MKMNDLKLLIIPDGLCYQKEIWYKRWEQKLTHSEILSLDQPNETFENWVKNISQNIEKSEKPVLLIAHGLGVFAAIKASLTHKDKVIGGFFVAPSFEKNYPDLFDLKKKLNYPSVVIASKDDNEVDFPTVITFSELWGSLFIEAKDSQHFNEESGHGPWPEGLLVFIQFLAKL